ncbi:MAG: hypothetical protein J4203_06025 [Candidatus Diapherotrites archaeon]|uniref:Uncharacterized protein n=1 Tax=Candidatus Iainarchaeum sp. TaxID=3101447 RepID=A0A8T4LBS7_9ARCH|nr:hypothetical protein [Candidatus Diapherotrites archaeon]
MAKHSPYKPFVISTNHAEEQVQAIGQRGSLSVGLETSAAAVGSLDGSIGNLQFRRFWAELARGLEARGIRVHYLVPDSLDRKMTRWRASEARAATRKGSIREHPVPKLSTAEARNLSRQIAGVRRFRRAQKVKKIGGRIARTLRRWL